MDTESNDPSNTRVDMSDQEIELPAKQDTYNTLSSADKSPPLLGPFDPTAHRIADFDFSIPAQFCHVLRNDRKRHVAKIRLIAQRHGSAARTLPSWQTVEFSHKRPELIEAFQKYQERKFFPSDTSPRKKATGSELPDAKSHIVGFDARWKEAQEEGIYWICRAKAELRNYMKSTEAHERTSTTLLKRSRDGNQLAGLNGAQGIDPDVEFLMGFPGRHMSAEKAFDLLESRDTLDRLDLEAIEEESYSSLVLPPNQVSAAAQISDENRKGRLEAAREKLGENPAHTFLAESPNSANDADSMPQSEEPLFPHQSSPFIPGRTFKVPSVYSDTATHFQIPSASPSPQKTPFIPGRTFKVPSVYSDTVASFPSPKKHPGTPRRQAPTDGVVDVDLHKQGDIFASAVKQKRTSPHPLPLPKPIFAHPPPPTNDRNSIADHLPVEEGDDFTKAAVMALANIAGDMDKIPNGLVAVSRNEGRFIVRFKFPEGYGDHFAVPEQMAPATMPQQVADEEDPRDILRQFVSKHQEGKNKTPQTAAETTPPTAAVLPSAATTGAEEPEEAAPQGPTTPEAAPLTSHPPMWMKTPAFSVSSGPSENGGEIEVGGPQRPRTPLGRLDRNSPSPVKNTAGGKRKLGDEAEPEPAQEGMGRASPKRRRGLRSQKSPATPVPAAFTAGTSRLVRNGEKDLASLTRANTRANKAGSIPPEEVLAKFAQDPMLYQWKERKAVVDAKAARVPKEGAKNVSWATELAQSQKEEEEDGPGPGPEVPGQEDAEPGVPTAGSAADGASTPVSPRRSSLIFPLNNKEPERTEGDASGEAPKKRGRPKSKLPAPVSRPPRQAAAGSAAPAETAEQADTVAPPRATRAAARKTNLRMGLTATGTPVRRKSARTSSKK